MHALMSGGDIARRVRLIGVCMLVFLAFAAAAGVAQAASDYAYTDLTPAQEEDLLREQFSPELRAIDADPARALSDISLLRIDSPTEALAIADGERVLLESEVPLRAPEEDGDLHKVELELEETADGSFEPANPLVDLTLPPSAAEPIEVGDDGIAITPEAVNDVRASQFGTEDLFLPAVREDTSFLLSPISDGLELSAMLLSRNSPERLAFDLSLPQGAVLQANENGGAEVVDDQGKVLAIVTAPQAVDAQGNEVPVSLSVDEGSLVLEVDHREMDVTYPLYVDPQVIEENWSGFSDTSKLSYWHWSWSGVGSEDYIGRTSCIVTCWGNGLYVRARSSFAYPAGSWGRWWFTPQGSTTYMRRVIMGPIHYDAHGCWANEPHAYVGVWNDYSGWKIITNAYPTGWITSFDSGEQDLGAGTRTAFVGIEAAKASTLSCGRDYQLGGATLFLDDPENPTVGAPSYPTGWIKDGYSFTIGVPVSDPGLGAYSATLSPSGALPITKQQGCNGHYNSACPGNYTFQFPISADSFDEGEKTVRASAKDAIEKSSNTYEWTMKVDRKPPEIDLAGQLAEATEETEGDSKDEKLYNALTLPVYKLEINATDGNTESAATKRSGVKRIEVFLDDGTTPLKTFEASSCPASSCPLSAVYTLKLNELSADTHHYLRVLATDFAGNTPRERKIEFEYIPATGMKDEYVMQYFPLPDGSGNEGEEEHPSRPELAVNLMNGNLVYRQQDLDVPGAGADLEVERYYSSLLPESQNSEWGDGWTLAQDPALEIEKPEAPGPATEGTMVEESGAVESAINLPIGAGEESFDKRLQATVTKEAGGGYEVADESGETDSTLAFEENGRLDEVRTGGAASVDYSYEGGALSEIAVEDPGTAQVDPETIQENERFPNPVISHAADFGTLGSEPGQLKSPADVATDAQANVWVLDRSNNRVEKFGSDGKYLSQFGGLGSGDGQFEEPVALTIDSAGNLWIVDKGNRRVEKFNSSGQFLSKFGSGGFGNGQLYIPNGIAIDGAGNIWVSDAIKVQRFSPAGTFLGVVESAGIGSSLAAGPEGNVYVTESGASRVSVFDKEGKLLRSFGSSGSGPGQFTTPTEVAVDPAGDVWVGDSGAGRVQLFSSSGDYIAQFGATGSGAGQFKLDQWMGIAADGQGRVWVSDGGDNRVEEWFGGNYQPSNEPVLSEDDPAVEVGVSEGLVDSVEGAGEKEALAYAHSGDLLTAADGPEGETKYEYDEAERLKKVTLPNGTYGEIAYEPAYGRVKSVTVAPEGKNPKTTYIEYQDEPRRTIVIPPDAPVTTYDFGADGSLFKWSNGKVPPTFDDLAGNLYDNRETVAPIAVGDYNLVIQPHSEEGIASIQVIANGDQLVDEQTCTQDPETPGIECKSPVDEWVTNTGKWPPGIVYLEVVATDRLGQSVSSKFWINIPYSPPPDPEAEERPTYEQILDFREEHGLDLDLKGNEAAINDRIFDLMGDWENPNTPAGEVARATAARWGVPLRQIDAAELDYRLAYEAEAVSAIPNWATVHASGAYAGYYIDERAGGLLYVGFTGGAVKQSELVEAFRESAGFAAPDRVRAFASAPSFSLATLISLQNNITNLARSNGSTGINSVSVAVEANRVTVATSDVEGTTAFLNKELGATAPFTVTYVSSPPPHRDSRERIEGPIRAGDLIRLNDREDGPVKEKLIGTICTAAFGAFDNVKAKSTGQTLKAMFVLSAGHCFLVGHEVMRRSDPSQKEKQWIGWVRREGDDGAPGNVDVDAAAIRLDPPSLVPRKIFTAPNSPRIPVQGVAVAPGVGTNVCYSGIRSNRVRCGPIFTLPRERYVPKEGNAITVEVCFREFIEGGDSGSPAWIEGTGLAVGIMTTGFDETESSEPVACFEPLKPYPEWGPDSAVLTNQNMFPLHLVTAES